VGGQAHARGGLIVMRTGRVGAGACDARWDSAFLVHASRSVRRRRDLYRFTNFQAGAAERELQNADQARNQNEEHT